MNLPTTHDVIEYAEKNPDRLQYILEKSLCQESLIDFIRVFWSEVEPSVDLATNWALEAMAEHLEAVSNDEIDNLLINVPPGMMKAAPYYLPVLTTHGWKQHGDLDVGDFVYGPDGRPKCVQARTPEVMEACYRVEFNDGTSVDIGSGHEWVVERDISDATTKHKRRRILKTVTTLDLKAGERGDRIPTAAPIHMPPSKQYIDPYLLGAWLGDGSSRGGTIFAAEDDAETILPYGEVSKRLPADGLRRKKPFLKIKVLGLAKSLRVMGLIENKHIPYEYLHASIDQRIALLQGLMDTDGHCDKGGRCTFTNKEKRLADGVKWIAESLGMVATIKSRFTELNGKTYGPHYSVGFRPWDGLQVFRMKRKQDRIIPVKQSRYRSRYVKSVSPIGKKRVRCIQVEGGIYLIDRHMCPTHNSLMCGTFWQAWEWGPRGRPDLQYITTSYAADLAKRNHMKTRSLIETDKFMEFYGYLVSKNPKKKDNETEYWLAANGMSFATGTLGKLTGYRADRIIVDDPHSVDGAESELDRERTVRWFTETLSTRFNNAKTIKRLVIMQRIHEGDVSGHILENMKGRYEHLMLPMRYEPDRRCHTVIGFKDPRKEDGELLFPERFPEKEQTEIEEDMMSQGGEYSVAGQMQQRPAPRGGGMFKVDKLNYCEMAPSGGKFARGWDFAGSVKKKSPYTAGVKGKLVKGNLYITDVVRVRQKIYEAEDTIVTTCKDDTRSVRQSLPQDPGQAGLSQVNNLAGRLIGLDFTFSPESGAKEDRAIPFASYVNAGKVYLVKGDWNKAFVSELKTFPRGTYKDQVDAASRMFTEVQRMPKRASSGAKGKNFPAEE